MPSRSKSISSFKAFNRANRIKLLWDKCNSSDCNTLVVCRPNRFDIYEVFTNVKKSYPKYFCYSTSLTIDNFGVYISYSSTYRRFYFISGFIFDGIVQL